MGTVPTKPDAQPDQRETAVRLLIAGHPYGAVRRIVLYVTLAVSVTLGIALLEATLWPLAVLALVVALIAYILLAMSDQLS